MFSVFKKITKIIALKALLNLYYKFKKTYYFDGVYSNWNQALLSSVGYSDDVILNRCKDATLKIKNGEAVYERDSVLFNKIEYSWLILTGLMHCVSTNNKQLHVLDFGGSLGSSYYQNKSVLFSIDGLSMTWNIVEQSHFVACGQNNFADKVLTFYKTIEECLEERKPNVLLLSSALQYLKEPYKWLDDFLSLNIEYIIFDRTPFTKLANDMILLQKVSAKIYKSSYPIWVFNEDNFFKKIFNKYNIILECDNTDFTNFKNMYFKGYVFKIKK